MGTPLRTTPTTANTNIIVDGTGKISLNITKEQKFWQNLEIIKPTSADTIRILCKKMQFTDGNLILESDAVGFFMPFNKLEFIDKEGNVILTYLREPKYEQVLGGGFIPKEGAPIS